MIIHTCQAGLRSLPPPKILGQEAKSNHYGDSDEPPITAIILMHERKLL